MELLQLHKHGGESRDRCFCFTSRSHFHIQPSRVLQSGLETLFTNTWARKAGSPISAPPGNTLTAPGVKSPPLGLNLNVQLRFRCSPAPLPMETVACPHTELHKCTCLCPLRKPRVPRPPTACHPSPMLMGRTHPGLVAAAPVPAPLGVVKSGFLSVFLLPLLRGFCLRAISPLLPPFSTHWEGSGSALAHPCGPCPPPTTHRPPPQSLHQCLAHLPVLRHLNI